MPSKRVFQRRERPSITSTPSRGNRRLRKRDEVSDDDDDDDGEFDFEEEERTRARGRRSRGGKNKTTQKRKRRADDSDSDADADAGEEDGDDEDGLYVAGGKRGNALDALTSLEKDDMVSRMVRYALFTDANKVPMKRDEITKAVLGKHHKQRDLFKHILAAANNQLKTVFGFEIKEIKKHTAKSSTSVWILRMHSASSDSEALDQGAMKERAQELLGHSSDETPQIGILMVILALIFANDGRISEETLDNHLKSLGLRRGEDHEVFGCGADKLLETFVRQLYLEKKKDELSNTAARAQADITGEEVKTEYLYMMGPRSKLEVQKMQILEFLSSVTGMAISDSTKARLEKEMEMSQEDQGTQVEETFTQASQSSQPTQATQTRGTRSSSRR